MKSAARAEGDMGPRWEMDVSFFISVDVSHARVCASLPAGLPACLLD